MSSRKREGTNNQDKAQGAAAVHTTSGSELEIEQRVLMKGNVMLARNSLLDFAQYNSWIKKSNYEGIFNAVIVIFIFMLIHKPFVRMVLVIL